MIVGEAAAPDRARHARARRRAADGAVVRLADVSIRRPVFAVMLIGGLVVLGHRLAAAPRHRPVPARRVPDRGRQHACSRAPRPRRSSARSRRSSRSRSTRSRASARSASASSDSLSLIYVEFELEYDIREKAQEVRDKVAAVRGELPRDVEPPVVDRVDPDAAPILAVMLSGPHSIRALSRVRRQAREDAPRARSPASGSVTLAGDRRARDPRSGSIRCGSPATASPSTT